MVVSSKSLAVFGAPGGGRVKSLRPSGAYSDWRKSRGPPPGQALAVSRPRPDLNGTEGAISHSGNTLEDGLMAKVILGFGAMLGIALGLLLPAPAHGVQHTRLIAPGTTSAQ